MAKVDPTIAAVLARLEEHELAYRAELRILQAEMDAMRSGLKEAIAELRHDLSPLRGRRETP
jgi:hypothetical protein